MFAYALRRLLQFIPTILVISLVMFILLNVLPGNAALMVAGSQDRNVDTHYIEQMKKDWGLDKPVWKRYLIYIGDLARGEMGVSFLRREPVNHLIQQRLWPTLRLALAAMVIVAGAILLEAALSFLGLGIQPPTPSWGGMLSTAREQLFTASWISVFPGLAIFITVLGLNLLGDGLRDILDPHTTRQGR